MRWEPLPWGSSQLMCKLIGVGTRSVAMMFEMFSSELIPERSNSFYTFRRCQENHLARWTKKVLIRFMQMLALYCKFLKWIRLIGILHLQFCSLLFGIFAVINWSQNAIGTTLFIVFQGIVSFSFHCKINWRWFPNPTLQSSNRKYGHWRNGKKNLCDQKMRESHFIWEYAKCRTTLNDCGKISKMSWKE